jgi:two-component system OmpR family response regulator
MVKTDSILTSPVTERIKALAQGMPLRVLVVDDDDIERLLLADRLLAHGFDVTAVSNGLQALEALDKEWFPVILTDRQMPEIDGIELTEKLRASGVTDTYVIMLTVKDSEIDYERGYLAGVDDYLSKKQPTTDLLARTHAAFSTIALRRSLKEARDALAAKG